MAPVAILQGAECPVCAARPRVVVAVNHPAMRGSIVDLLARDHACWAVSSVQGFIGLEEALSADLDLAVIDAADFAACSSGILGSFPLSRIVVIGPEPDPAYQKAVLDRGAGAWVSRDGVAEELSAALCSILGCVHRPCPCQY